MKKEDWNEKESDLAGDFPPVGSTLPDHGFSIREKP